MHDQWESMELHLSDFTVLIKHLPFEQQAFTTSKGTWKKYNNNKTFGKFYNELFENETIEVSRGDIFKIAQRDFNSTIFSIIFWGYPRNMRGNLFGQLLKNLEKLKDSIHGKTHLTEEDFLKLKSSLKGTGLGLSTLTKFLYFFNVEFDGCRSLILDSRIISVLQERRFSELSELTEITEFKKDNYYIPYIRLMNKLAKQNGYSVDQLELFLFMFGNNLKARDGESKANSRKA